MLCISFGKFFSTDAALGAIVVAWLGIPPEFRRNSAGFQIPDLFLPEFLPFFFRFPIGLCVPAIFLAFRYTFPP
jgi:hypothetical protein